MKYLADACSQAGIRLTPYSRRSWGDRPGRGWIATRAHLEVCVDLLEEALETAQLPETGPWSVAAYLDAVIYLTRGGLEELPADFAVLLFKVDADVAGARDQGVDWALDLGLSVEDVCADHDVDAPDRPA